MKRRWTPEKAIAYIKDVEDGKRPYGLTYCSARSYLYKKEPKTITERN